MMTPRPLEDLSRLCLHTMTNKTLTLEQCIEHYQQAGIRAITVWRNVLEPLGAGRAGTLLRESGLEVVSLCRGGFFPATSARARQAAIDDNRRAIDEARTIGAPLIVLVCGAAAGQPLDVSRQQIRKGIAAILPEARAAGVKLSIEPLHPMYADTRSAINTIRQANDMIEELDDRQLGLTVDVYHLWWDSELEQQLRRAGRSGKLFSFHVCDWRTPTRDLLNDRAIMGQGCIDVRGIRGMVEAAGFSGYIEVEIFSDDYWRMDQREYLERIKVAYLTRS